MSYGKLPSGAYGLIRSLRVSTLKNRHDTESDISPTICYIELRCRCLAANTDRSIMRVHADRGAAGCLHVGRQDLIDQRRVPGTQRLIAAPDGGLGFGHAFAD
jgi:hypothetical protein